jgi:predicted Zn-dependent protease with MMP-like domain
VDIAMSQDSADELVLEAANAVGPIFRETMEELGLGIEDAQRLMLRIVEAYIKGRADGADTFALQVNHALGANGVAAVVLPRHARARRPEERLGL